MKNLLIVAHPEYNNSQINKAIVSRIENAAQNTDVHILNSSGNFDVAAEQKLLLQHNTITFAFPMWWYNAPWILQKYFSEVFSANFAYSITGDVKHFKLIGKRFTYMVTLGSALNEYSLHKGSLTSVENYLSWMKAIFSYVSSAWKINDQPVPENAYFLKPIIVYNTSDMESAIEHAAEKYLTTIDIL